MHKPERTIAIILAMSVLILAGCDATREGTGRVVGTITGGLLGSQVGSGAGRVATSIAGSILGGYIGGRIGRSMDEQDRRRANSALTETPTGQSSRWVNPDNGNRYRVTPTRTYYRQPGGKDARQPCREYTTEAWIDGKKQTLFGTACRDARGEWRPTDR